MAISAFKRYELKFLLTRNQYKELLPDIAKYMQPDLYCQDNAYYGIYNIYYDTPDNAIILASLAKPYHKEKFRMRCYDSPARPDSIVFLELKKKTANIVHKRRATMTLAQANAFIDEGIRPPYKSYMNEQVLHEISYFLSCNEVHPTTYIGYKRKAFFGKDNSDFRITFDYDIFSRREALRLDQSCYGDALLPNDTLLMEVKITGAVPIWLADRFSDLQIYKTSFSKYGTDYVRRQSLC